MALGIEVALIILIVFLIIMLFVIYKYALAKGRYEKDLEWQSNLGKIRSDVAERQRVGIKGRVTEAFAPFLKGFPFKASECKFIGDPVDYIVFEGLDERNIRGIHLVEVKEGSSKLSKHQKEIKDLIDSLKDERVTFRLFGFNSEL